MARILLMTAVILATAFGASPRSSAQTFYPDKDGTLVDGGVFGPYDGTADDWDWTFNGSAGFEGLITLTRGNRTESLEHRVVWEYDLSSVTLDPPVSATLTFTIRTPAAWPRDDFYMHVYSYPADLQETPDDYHMGPTVLEGAVLVEAWDPPDPPPVVQHSVDVSGVVSQALLSGEDKVAFRFQVNPDTPNEANQAHIDAEDAVPETKPYLIIAEGVPVPGDADGDGDVDLDDHVIFVDCLAGPGATPNPTLPGVTPEICFEAFDSEPDNDVDLEDFGPLQSFLGGVID